MYFEAGRKPVWGSKCCHHALSCLFLVFHTFLLTLLKLLPFVSYLNANWFQFLFADACHGIQNVCSTMLSLKLSASVTLCCLFWQVLLPYPWSSVLLSQRLILLYYTPCQIFFMIFHLFFLVILSMIFPYLSSPSVLRLLLLGIPHVKDFRNAFFP